LVVGDCEGSRARRRRRDEEGSMEPSCRESWRRGGDVDCLLADVAGAVAVAAPTASPSLPTHDDELRTAIC